VGILRSRLGRGKKEDCQAQWREQCSEWSRLSVHHGIICITNSFRSGDIRAAGLLLNSPSKFAFQAGNRIGLPKGGSKPDVPALPIQSRYRPIKTQDFRLILNGILYIFDP
jgi:hypothetical protein